MGHFLKVVPCNFVTKVNYTHFSVVNKCDKYAHFWAGARSKLCRTINS